MLQHVQLSLFGCLACFWVISVVSADGRVFVLDLRNYSGLQGFRDAEQVCASQHARLASAEELRHAVVECFFSPCTRGWLHGGTVGTTVCNIVGSAMKAVDVRTENATDDTAQLNAFCVKDKDMPCGDPPSFPNARLQDHSGFEMGDELLYTCVPGHVMPSGQSAFSLLCDSCGEWYGLVQICVKDETESHIDYTDKFTESYEEEERHNDRPEEAHGELHEELHRHDTDDGKSSLEQQETRTSVEVEEEHPDRLEEHQIEEEVTGPGRTFENPVDPLVANEDQVAEDLISHPHLEQASTEVIRSDVATATEAPVSLLSQKHLFWFPSEAFQEEGPPVSSNPVSQTTTRASGGESEESKEQESQEGAEHQHTIDVDDYDRHTDGDVDDQDQDDHNDSHHEDQDNDGHSHYNDRDNDDSHQHEDQDIRGQQEHPDRHDEHYDMGEHEDERDHVRYGSRDYDDPDDRYEHESYEDHHGGTEEADGKEDEEDHDGSEAHDRDDHEDDHDDGQVPYVDVDDHDHDVVDEHKEDDDDHDSHEEDDDHHQHVVFSIDSKKPGNVSQNEAGVKEPTEESWLDGYPIRADSNGESTVRPETGGREDSGRVVMTTDRPNEVEIRRPVSYTESPEDPKSPPSGPESEQGVSDEVWPRFTGTSAPLPELPEPSDPPSFSDTLDYDTQQAAPTHSWLDDLTEHPIFDHGPAPPVHDDDNYGGVIEEHTVLNLPGESGERGESEGKMGETICTGEDCPPHHPSSTSRGPTLAAIIVAVCAIATAVIAGVWCYHRRQRKSSVYEMNGKGQNPSRQGQHIEMQQKV